MSNLRKTPNEWTKTTLGKIISIRSGKSRPSETGEYPIYGGNGVLGYAKQFNVEGPMVIVGRVGAYCGNVFFEENNFWLSDNALGVSSKNTDLNYIFYLLKYLKLNSRAIGGAQPLLTQGIINQIEVDIPESTTERSKIANVLVSLDKKIKLFEEQNKTLESITQTLFKHWFVDFEFPNEEGKPYKSSGGKTKDSELGEIPKIWISGRINDFIGELESGNRPKGGVGNLKKGIPSVGAESINGIDNFDFSKTKYISEDYFGKMKKGKIKDYDILIYKDGGTPGTFKPRFSMAGEGFPFREFAINEHVFRLQSKYDYERFYLYLWLNSTRCKKQLQNIGGKAAIPGINSTDFKNLTLLIPDKNTLSIFDSSVTSIFKKILMNNNQVKSLSCLRDILLPKLMKGEIKI